MKIEDIARPYYGTEGGNSWQLDSYVLSVSTSLSNLDGVNGCSVVGETTTTFQSFKVKFGRI